MTAIPRRARLIAVAGVVAIGVVLLVLATTGLLGRGMGDSVRPACDTLGTHRQAQTALDEHPDLVALLTGAGATDVAVTDPCGEADQSIITVRYATDTAREAIDDVLSENAGFSVAVEVVRD